jgi:L-iditol 2-dehydrogenase
MLAAVLYGREDVRVERVPLAALGLGEVRVRIRAALTCGTDVKVYRRGYHARMIRPPALFGHEFAGVIEAVGAEVTGWKIGDRVVAANSAPCGGCVYCRRDLPELCEDLLFLNGAYAERITVPARVVDKNLLRLPDGVSFEAAALTEPLACVVHGMEAAPVAAGSNVVVLGLGPIGLLFVRLCVLAGAQVLAVGRRAARLDLAARLGAAEVIDESECSDLAATVRARTEEGIGADMVIEAVGTPAAWETAIALVRKAGVVSLFGGCPAGTSIPLDTHRLHYDEITLVGAFHHTPYTVCKALQLIVSGAVPAEAFIGHRAPLDEVPHVLADLAAGHTDAVKVGILPG